ncbi:MAG: replication initiation protein [Fusobacteriaceae bacterium]
MSLPIHKQVNRMSMTFETENALNCFIGLMKEVSKGEVGDTFYKKYEKSFVWSLAFPNEKYREEEFKKLIKELTVSFRVENISGSLFIMQERGHEITVEVPQTYLNYLYSKSDLHIISKASKRETLTVQELDYWDTTLKDKKKQLLLLEEAEIRGIRGKYAKRLYMLLKQFEPTGYFVMGIEQFRKVMEVPESYTLSQLNDKIIKKVQNELAKKEIFEFPNESKGKGRRKIEKIEIKFKPMKNGADKKILKTSKPKSLSDNSITEAVVVENSLDYENLQSEKLSPEVLEFREKAKKISKTLLKSKHFEFLAQLIPARTIKDIEELCESFGILEQVK